MKADVSLELFLDSGVSVLAKHIELLKAVEHTKSITKAAEYVGISYKNAWDSLDALNNRSDEPLIARAEGNKKNSGAHTVRQKDDRAIRRDAGEPKDIFRKSLFKYKRRYERNFKFTAHEHESKRAKPTKL